MPNRTIRDSALSSKSLARLSDFSERLFWRLIATADDFGRFEADAEIVATSCFRRNPQRPEAVEEGLAELAFAPEDDHPLIVLYTVGRRRYGQFFSDRYFNRRAKFSKHPAPPADTCSHLRASASTCEQVPAYAPEDRGARNEDRGTRIEVLRPQKADEKTQPPSDSPPSGEDGAAQGDAVHRIFLAWREQTRQQPNVKLTRSRREKILARLKDSSEQEILAAIAACAASEFHMGANDRGRPYNDLAAHVLKSREKVEWWLARPAPGYAANAGVRGTSRDDLAENELREIEQEAARG